MDQSVIDLSPRSAAQQPGWDDPAALCLAREHLAKCPALVDPVSIERLHDQLAEVAAGNAYVIQAGDCAEDPAECTAGDVIRKAGLLEVLAGVVEMNTRKPVVRAGRIAGQYGKPRSAMTERVGGVEVAVYRGHLVNCPEPDPRGRRPDPRRLVTGYQAAREVMRHLGWHGRRRRWGDPPIWTSHEALILDYEIPMVRRDGSGRPYLSSTHWPWIGERTRQVDGPHVALLARVTNPVGCKIGPATTRDQLLELCERLDPERRPGRLALIARLGAGHVAELLPPLVRAVRAAGHPVMWLVDPMHANTVTTPEGLKTRYVTALIREVREFQHAVRAAGGTAAGLHLEATPEPVTECVIEESCADRVGEKYMSFCDPRLNPTQAVSVVSAWRG